MFFEIFIYFSPSQFSSQQQLQRIRRLPFRLLNGVDVAVGGFELGVAEAGCYVFDIGAVAQQQRRRGVAQGVELLVREVVALEKFAEPERRRGRVHRLAVCLDEYPTVAVPGVAQSELQSRLLRAVAFEHGNAVRGQHDPPAFARLGGLAPDLLIACQLVVAPADGQNTRAEINIAPLHAHQLASAAACTEREVDEQLVLQRLRFKCRQHGGQLLLTENLRLFLLDLREGDAVAVGWVLPDQAQPVRAVQQGADHRVIAVDARRGKPALGAVKMRFAADKLIDKALNVQRTDILELHVSEHGDNADVEHPAVPLVNQG